MHKRYVHVLKENPCAHCVRTSHCPLNDVQEALDIAEEKLTFAYIWLAIFGVMLISFGVAFAFMLRA